MIRISHEVPLCMLKESRSFNDYDYALVHLLDKYPEYLSFYKESLKMGREVILDNSLYELGEAFDMQCYYDWIKKLDPTYYIIPDTFWDSQATVSQAETWMNDYGWRLPNKKIGVAQGCSYDEIRQSYLYMSEFCDTVAFTFKYHPQMIEDMGEYENITDAQAHIRYKVLSKLEGDGIINHNIRHHLLGMQNTLYLKEICQLSWIDSIDTSNPVMYGLEGYMYGRDGNAHIDKPILKLDNVFEREIDLNSYDKIIYNIDKFREMTKK